MFRQEGHFGSSPSTSACDAAAPELMYPCVEPSTPTPWTMEEFTEFWDYLRKVIERGRAGYDVFATLEHCEAHNDCLVACIFGWPETLSHIWLVLYVLSNGLITRMPLQWFGPGEGALITMSGQPNRGGSLGRWVEQKSGADGYWGIERSWEGLEATMHSSR